MFYMFIFIVLRLSTHKGIMQCYCHKTFEQLVTNVLIRKALQPGWVVMRHKLVLDDKCLLVIQTLLDCARDLT